MKVQPEPIIGLSNSLLKLPPAEIKKRLSNTLSPDQIEKVLKRYGIGTKKVDTSPIPVEKPSEKGAGE